MINYLFIYPEIIISAGLCIIIIIDLFISANYKSISYYLIQIILAYCVYHIFSYSEFMNTNTSNLYDTSTFSNIFKVFIILILLLIFYYTSIFLKYFNKSVNILGISPLGASEDSWITLRISDSYSCLTS